MTMPGFSATASLYGSRGHNYKVGKKTFGQSQGIVSLAQAVGGRIPTTTGGLARCLWRDGNTPLHCRKVVEAWYDESGSYYTTPNSLVLVCGSPLAPIDPEWVGEARGEATWSGPDPQEPACTLTR